MKKQYASCFLFIIATFANNTWATEDSFLPLISGDIKATKVELKNIATETEVKTNPRIKAAYVVGGEDINTYYYIEIPLPETLKDIDGGTIRLIMQHELDPDDQVRVIDEHIATEYKDDRFGKRGRNKALYGWTRQSGGGDYAWMLGDIAAHTIFNPWGWAWGVDYKWGQDNGVLGGETIRIYSHPHVTTRVIILD